MVGDVGTYRNLSEDEARRLRKASDDPGTAMLATLSDRREFDENWVVERKLDGVRALATRDGERVSLLSRGAKAFDDAFPELVDALAEQECTDFTIDGEIVALHDDVTDFSRLQQRIGITKPAEARASSVAVTYFVFDLLRLDGYDTTRLPLLTRKSLLHDVLRFGGPLRYTTHRPATGDARPLLEEACSKGWEGLIAKRADASYVHRRSPTWLKLKCARGQEFVVGGFTEPSGSRVGFGALLLGYYDGDRLRYAGKVGTGWDTRTLRRLRAELDELEQRESPFDGVVREPAVHWVRPSFVAQIGFTEWTRDGMLRHPRYLGRREDKRARDVVREEPARRT
ncbi:non-homologous end-joining DNA ligase [Actinospica sp.]|jgi:bifunctional non-homologous end joining protein LigD|uniref:non-homologous end-joining DNA ligase n=1 Tax=Actinospica sp. TaxID=1872142 RepID=UPI0039C8A28C